MTDDLTMPTYALMALIGIDPTDPTRTTELTKELDTLDEIPARIRELGDNWRAVTIVHIEELPGLLEGAQHVGRGPAATLLAGRRPTDLFTMPAWCDNSDTNRELARKATHDALIHQAGDRRRTGVTWIQVQGAEALDTLRLMGETAIGLPSDVLAAYLEISRLLRTFGGWLIIATCEIGPP